LPSIKNNLQPVPSRYYGTFLNDKIKTRGIELRKHDTPLIIKEMQAQIIFELSKTQSYHDFKKAMLYSKKFLDKTIKRILLGYVSQKELAIKKRISKIRYKNQIANSIVIHKLEEQGYSINPGDVISYIISDKKSSFPKKRYNPTTDQQKFRYDKNEYIKLAKKAYYNLFPNLKEQLTIYEALNNDNTRNKIEELPLQIPAGLI
jgi:DNA polymerase elongation subunit (family B)